MEEAKEPKEAASKCLEKIELDADKYRIGHTKASNYDDLMIKSFFFYCNVFKLFCIIH